MKTKQHIKLITNLERSMAEIKEAVHTVRTHRNRINRASTVARSIDGEAHIYTSGSTVHIHVSVRGLHGFKAGKLTRAITRISKITGVEFDSTNDYAETGNRDLRGRGDLFVVTISAYLNDAPKNCRKVIVRTERIERPVYEMICK
jgi:hypothetical protein